MTQMMPVVGYRESLPIGDPDSLVDAELAVPVAQGHDLLVRVEAVSVNPVDVKVRARSDPKGELKILGYDAAGTVVATGPEVTRFRAGDSVYYAGSVGRSGSNARYHLVDEHIVGLKPTTLDYAEAAALPLTLITAWETLFEKFALTRESTGTLLVVGAAGGVGSIMLQLARQLTGLTVIGSASRPQSREWALRMGAEYVVNHHGGLAKSTEVVAPDGVDYLFTAFSEGQLDEFVRLVRPRGQIAAIDDPKSLDITPLKSKSISWHWEFMFTRPLYAPTDWYQHELLTSAAELVDAGTLRSTISSQLGPISAATLREAHAQVESSGTVGKVVIAGW